MTMFGFGCILTITGAIGIIAYLTGELLDLVKNKRGVLVLFLIIMFVGVFVIGYDSANSNKHGEHDADVAHDAGLIRRDDAQDAGNDLSVDLIVEQDLNVLPPVIGGKL